MAIEVTMPRLSDTMEEGTLVSWRVSVGDDVSAGDVLADVETDKATMELNAFDDGKVAKLVAGEGDTLPVGGLICVLAEEGEDTESAAASASSSGGAESSGAESSSDDGSSSGDADEQREGQANADAPSDSSSDHAQRSGSQSDASDQLDTAAEASSGGGDASDGDASHADDTGSPSTASGGDGSTSAGGGVKASPLARKLADEHGVDISQIEGTGPGGRVIKRDVLAASGQGGQAQEASGQAPDQGAASASAGAGQPAPSQPQGARSQGDRQSGLRPVQPSQTPPQPTVQLEGKRLTLSSMRKTIAKRLAESKQSIPHFSVTMQINMDPVIDLRRTLNQQLESQGVKLSVNDFVVRAAALSLVQHPTVNSSWADDGIVQHGTVNVGIAVALEEEKGGGLVVPLIREAHQKGLRQISAESKQMAEKARSRGLSPDDMSDGTFTVSNLGMFGVAQFNAIINPPQAAILAVGAAMKKPVVRNDELTVGHEMACTLSADHRVIDGAMAAQFLATMRSFLESPAVLMV